MQPIKKPKISHYFFKIQLVEIKNHIKYGTLKMTHLVMKNDPSSHEKRLNKSSIYNDNFKNTSLGHLFIMTTFY